LLLKFYEYLLTLTIDSLINPAKAFWPYSLFNTSPISLSNPSSFSSSLTSLATANQLALEALVSLKTKMDTAEAIEEERGELNFWLLDFSWKKERILGLLDKVELLVEWLSDVENSVEGCLEEEKKMEREKVGEVENQEKEVDESVQFVKHQLELACDFLYKRLSKFKCYDIEHNTINLQEWKYDESQRINIKKLVNMHVN
jgi:hypothetical protein